MAIQIHFDQDQRISETWSKPESLQSHWKSFLQTIENENIGFFHVNQRKELLQNCLEVFEKFQSRKTFVHVGIGGSSLGPEMLVSALGDGKRHFEFINNIDPDKIQHSLSKVNPKEAIFYFCSKSGSTAEMTAALALIKNWLADFDISEKDLKNYFIFATDPKKSDLLELGRSWDVTCLEVPSNVGGRFSVLTPVGLLPALFAGIDTAELLKGAGEIKKTLLEKNLSENILLKSANYLLSLKDQGYNQTVLMPYSSLLRDFSFWFVQLWAESLGKKKNSKGEVVETGFTPIPAYGATDQHSQVQLFMEGPRDKTLLFLEVENFQHDFSLSNELEGRSFQRLAKHTLSQLMKAELKGTLKAMEEENRPFLHIRLDGLTANNLGQLILYFEALTALTGLMLNIDPFDQPGVEAGKRYAFQWLEELSR